MDKVFKDIERGELKKFLISKNIIHYATLTKALELFSKEKFWQYNIVGYREGADCFDPRIIRLFLEKKNEEDLYLERMEYFISNLDTQEDKLSYEFISIKAQLDGVCLECNRKVNDWVPMFGSFAPEWWSSKREQGIDPASGHLLSCSKKTGR